MSRSFRHLLAHEDVACATHAAQLNSAAVQVLFFSATLHSDAVKTSVERFCHNPIWCDLKVRGLLCGNLAGML